MRRSRSPASSCYTASARDSSHCDVSAFKAELHLQSGTRCFGPEHHTARQGLFARDGYLHQSHRRNKIVHEGDLQPMVPRTPWLIDRSDVSQVTTFINDVVGAIDSIV